MKNDKKRVLIIAEAGVNHNGDVNLAKKLVDVAVDCGADIIKFQTFKAETLVTKTAKMANYQIANTQKQESQFDMLKKLELSYEDFIALKKYCEEKKITFLSTGFDLESVKFLSELGLKLWKIPSGEITNLPYLEFIGKLGHEVILSTGMSTLEEVRDAVNILVKSGTDKKMITVLHCNTDYPTKFEDVNLNAMLTIKSALGLEIGYSDHTLGVEVPTAAVAMGATVIEKHFTLDKTMPGPDHKASLDPQELKQLVSNIRNIELALLGSGNKEPSSSEKKNMEIARKSIVAKKEIAQGELFSLDNLIVKRPGSGISPMRWYEVIGKRAARNFKEDELIEI